MYDVNVTGTRNVLAACVAHRIPRLVYTSTASVVFAGKDLWDVDETAPVPHGAFLDFYTSTKAEAEGLVRDANGVGGVSTVCLRPSGTFWGGVRGCGTGRRGRGGVTALGVRTRSCVGGCVGVRLTTAAEFVSSGGVSVQPTRVSPRLFGALHDSVIAPSRLLTLLSVSLCATLQDSWVALPSACVCGLVLPPLWLNRDRPFW